MKRFALLVVVLGCCGWAWGGDIDFAEKFALSTDREAAIAQLVSGTDQYYYYRCLQWQNTGKLDEVDGALAPWAAAHGKTPLYLQIENRQALLRYATSPQKTLDFLVNRLALRFDHARTIAGPRADLPTTLDANLISRQTLTARELARNPRSTDGFALSALGWLAQRDLSWQQRRHLLGRLDRPDYPGLVKLIASDLDEPQGHSFGALPVHAMLTQAQLDELLLAKGYLLNQHAFVHAYLSKLRPGADTDLPHDLAQQKAHLERVWSFVQRLGPVHNSLKANVLYNRLVLDRKSGRYDKDLFMEYLKLPRACPYMRAEYLEDPARRDNPARLGDNFSAHTGCGPIGDDTPLVRDVLMHFLADAKDFNEYLPFVNDTFIKEAFVEAKATGGIGDLQALYGLASPQFHQALKDRIDIDFDPSNKTLFAADEAVKLTVNVKNVTNLIVKVYQINAGNWYREKGQGVGLDIDLEGLTANEEQTLAYDSPPLRRVARTFELKTLSKPGVYVVEFIGNGISSRALIQKGLLRHIERRGAAGHVFTILDENNRKVPDAAIWMSGHLYAADKDGTITIPFSTSGTDQSIVITRGELACLARFKHVQEDYSLAARFYVDRESLLAGRKAAVIVRSALLVAGQRAAISLVEEPSLTIVATDREGTKTTREIKDFKLTEDQESTAEFQVPENLCYINFTLKGKVQNLSRNKKEDLSDSEGFPLNEIDKTLRTADVHLMHAGRRYVLEVRGKTGEPLASRSVEVALWHKDFTQNVQVMLRSDDVGRIVLGPLPDIRTVSARVSGDSGSGTTGIWDLRGDLYSPIRTVTARAGKPIRVPYMGKAAKPQQPDFSLLEVRQDTFAADHFDAMKIEDGYLVIAPLPPGFYTLRVEDQSVVNIHVTAGAAAEGYYLTPSRKIEASNPAPLQIASVTAGKDEVKIKLSGAGVATRVYVTATRYMPRYDLMAFLGSPLDSREPAIEPSSPLESSYAAGRNIGDEYRYILDRKYAKKYPGNMLERPGLLLNPWAADKTDVSALSALRADQLIRGASVGSFGGRVHSRFGEAMELMPAGSNLDFLSQQAAVLIGLKPDADGVVTVARKDLGLHHQVRILAVNASESAMREFSLDEAAMPMLDLRLDKGALAEKHFAQQKHIETLQSGQSLTLRDAASSKWETYDSLARAYGLYVTLAKGDAAAKLAEFAFILNWPAMKDAEKREKYSQYACHELNFFLYKKDPDFFRKVILPYLRNKKDKTFMDRWMIGEDLSAYAQPWAFGRLNAVERILLGQRLPREGSNVSRHISDTFNLIPPNQDYFNELFRVALAGSALEAPKPGSRPVEAKPLEQARKELETAQAGGESAVAAEAPPAPPETPDGIVRGGETLASLKESLKEDKHLLQALGTDVDRRGRMRQLYRQVDQTQELAENNYYRLPIAAQNDKLVGVNAFWNDYADYAPAGVRSKIAKGPFLSAHFAQANGSFTEIMFALAVLDLPFTAPKHDIKTEPPAVTLKAGGPTIVLVQEIQPAKDDPAKLPILVSQNYFSPSDRYRYEGPERLDKFVTEEFLVGAAYGCQVIVTNPTSSPRKLELLLQVPRGAMPVQDGLYTRSVSLDLPPYTTKTQEYFFYFPLPGAFNHYGVRVSRNGLAVGGVSDATLKAVAKLTRIDTTSWEYISQDASAADVLRFMKDNSIERLNLERIAWRMADKAFFQTVIALLKDRHVYSDVLWSYALKHDDAAAAAEYLRRRDDFLAACGPYLDSPLVKIDPVVRGQYQHLEYAPLINARAHKLGPRRQIANDRLAGQYASLLQILACKRTLDDDDLMAVTYYMLLQDRVEEGLAFFGRVKPDALATRLQYDYFKAYAAFYAEDLPTAAAVAKQYADYPVDRWRKLFNTVAAQLDEIAGKKAPVVDDKNREQVQANLAGGETSVDFTVEARKITVTHQNAATLQVHYYLMDVELLFSKNPFVQETSGQFAYVKPSSTAIITPKAGAEETVFDLPKEYHNSNVMIEIVAGSARKSQAYYANSMNVQMVENYGRLRVTGPDGKAMSKVYVKVYARHAGQNEPAFYKDGYTDLRGMFDYASVSISNRRAVEKFAVLVFSEANGAVVREANPPAGMARTDATRLEFP
ncbi:MAG: hypothetical protein LLG01_06490 [Planctomycetaceae bacterium]|nr:hypothetical protein [Planctomycetaceae bacterium]